MSHGLYFGNWLAFFQWGKSADWFSLCNVSHPPRGMKIAFCTHSCVWLFITKATYKKRPCDKVLLEFVASLHGEWQLCWGWAWLAAVPQCCVPRILSLCNSCSSHRQRDGVRTEETRRGCCNPWRERTRETDTFIVYVCVQTKSIWPNPRLLWPNSQQKLRIYICIPKDTTFLL